MNFADRFVKEVSLIASAGMLVSIEVGVPFVAIWVFVLGWLSWSLAHSSGILPWAILAVSTVAVLASWVRTVRMALTALSRRFPALAHAEAGAVALGAVLGMFALFVGRMVYAFSASEVADAPIGDWLWQLALSNLVGSLTGTLATWEMHVGASSRGAETSQR